MLPQELIRSVDTYWAGVLDCSVTSLRDAQPSVVRTEKSPGLTALRVEGGPWVISYRPELPDAAISNILPVLENQDFSDGHARTRMHSTLSQYSMRDMYGPSEILYITREAFRPLDEIPFRTLTTDDQAICEAFRIEMGGTVDWKLGDPVGWPYVIGTFHDNKLIAVGAVHNWDDLIGETYVDTLPAYRGRGLANHLTSETTRWILEETDLIPQAGGEIINPAAGRISRRLGYSMYATLMMNNLCRRP